MDLDTKDKKEGSFSSLWFVEGAASCNQSKREGFCSEVETVFLKYLDFFNKNNIFIVLDYFDNKKNIFLK